MREVNVKIYLPEFIYQIGVKAILLYRRLRYGEAFRLIPLTKGMFAIVSPEDYDRLSKFKWHADKHGRNIYAQWTAGAKSGKRRGFQVMMHRMVMGVEDERLVDHRNHNGLDDRRSNLRIATVEENGWNKRKPISSSGRFKGARWVDRRGRWEVLIGYKCRKIVVGYYKTEEEAARAYDAKAKELFGEYAALNFPEEQRKRADDWSFKICYGGFTG